MINKTEHFEEPIRAWAALNSGIKVFELDGQIVFTRWGNSGGLMVGRVVMLMLEGPGRSVRLDGDEFPKAGCIECDPDGWIFGAVDVSITHEPKDLVALCTATARAMLAEQSIRTPYFSIRVKVGAFFHYTRSRLHRKITAFATA